MVMHLQEIFIFFQTFYFAISKCKKNAKKVSTIQSAFNKELPRRYVNNDIPTTEFI